MKILHCIYSTNPAGGGPVEVIKQFAGVAALLGHQVEVLSLDGPQAAHLKNFPLPVHALGPVSSKYGYSPRVVPWLQSNAREFDVVVVDGVWQYHSWAAWRALHRGPTPYVVFTHGMLDPWFQRTYPLKHIKKVPYWLACERRVLRDAAAVLYTSEEERVLARDAFPLYQANERIVHPGTAPPADADGPRRDIFLDRFPELRDSRTVLFLGRLHPKKGCDVLLESFAEAFLHDPEWRLVMAGPDQIGWRTELEQIASRCGIGRRVTWTGMLNEFERWGAYRASDVFVLPSHQENFGIVVAEALASGLPVLLSDKVNIWREVVAAGAGFVANDDVRGTVSSLKRWQTMLPAEQTAMRGAARECFLDKFDSRVATRNFLEVISSFTSTPVAEFIHA